MRDLGLSILFASRPVIEFTLRRLTECVSRQCLTGAAFVTSSPALFPQLL